MIPAIILLLFLKAKLSIFIWTLIFRECTTLKPAGYSKFSGSWQFEYSRAWPEKVELSRFLHTLNIQGIQPLVKKPLMMNAKPKNNLNNLKSYNLWKIVSHFCWEYLFPTRYKRTFVKPLIIHYFLKYQFRKF